MGAGRARRRRVPRSSFPPAARRSGWAGPREGRAGSDRRLALMDSCDHQPRGGAGRYLLPRRPRRSAARLALSHHVPGPRGRGGQAQLQVRRLGAVGRRGAVRAPRFRGSARVGGARGASAGARRRGAEARGGSGRVPGAPGAPAPRRGKRLRVRVPSRSRNAPRLRAGRCSPARLCPAWRVAGLRPERPRGSERSFVCG